MAAFQRASNRLHELGGGRLRLAQDYYYLGRYRGSDVGGKILSKSLGNDVISATWVIPSNVMIGGDRSTQIDLGGGPSEALGFKGNFNVLSAPLDHEGSTDVVALSLAPFFVSVKSAEQLRVGQTVRLAREAQPPGGTPSNEDAPNQFFTIRAISGNNIRFAELPAHRFDAAQDLVVRFLTSAAEYPRNIFFENLRFTTRGPLAYVLHSRTINSGWKNVTLDKKVNASWGTCQQVRSDGVAINADLFAKSALSIESTSDVEWGSLILNGNGSNNAVGGLFVDDHSRAIHFQRIIAKDFTRGGVTFMYGVDAVIGELTLSNCATLADPRRGFNAALSVGFPADGAGPTASTSNAMDPRYLVRNSGTTSVRIGKLKITGPSTVPIRSHDATLTIDHAYIEFASTLGGAPFVVGESGTTRADPDYFPMGAQGNVQLGDVTIKTVFGVASTTYAINRNRSFFQRGTGRLSASQLMIDGKRGVLRINKRE
ncbi:hypothetical protein [Paraburkholderia sediminicola]|uniref:hypothetical protein n=1 Tax=Paraburkholderia sediminicola TaxID=458836 RepID=UPI0038BA99FC